MKNKKYKLIKKDSLSETISTIKENPFKDNVEIPMALANIPPAILSMSFADDAFLKVVVPCLLCGSSVLLIYNGLKKYLSKEKIDSLQFLLRKKGIDINILDDFVESKEIFDSNGQEYILNSFSDDKKIISKDGKRFIYFDKDNYDGIDVTNTVEKTLMKSKNKNGK